MDGQQRTVGPSGDSQGVVRTHGDTGLIPEAQTGVTG